MSEVETTAAPKGQLPINGKCTCSKCHKNMAANKSFFTYRDGSKSKMCKSCITMHVDVHEPDSYLWLLEEFDVPYVPSEWRALLEASYKKDPSNPNDLAVLGKYLSKMKLRQFKDYHWADSQMLQEREAANLAAAGIVEVGTEEERKAYESQIEALKEQLDSGQITKAQYETMLPAEVLTKQMIEEKAAEEAAKRATPTSTEQIYQVSGNMFDENEFLKDVELPDLTSELTEEDKIYLIMKWGVNYKATELIELERNYNEMMASFDIQDADTINTLKLICKTNLKLNQAIDIGDMDGYQKLSRVYETLRKSAKFTAAQNKADKDEYVDSIGELVAMCEREEGFIPRFCTDIPQDKVDYTLQDMNKYLYKLVTNDLGFGQQIETYIKKIELEKEAEKERELQDQAEEDQSDNQFEIEDEDIKEYYEALEEQAKEDSKITVDSSAVGFERVERKEDESDGVS